MYNALKYYITLLFWCWMNFKTHLQLNLFVFVLFPHSFYRSYQLHVSQYLHAKFECLSFFPGLVDPTVLVEPLTEERAARTLYRIELLRKIREQVGKLHHEGQSTKAARVEHLFETLLLSQHLHVN